MTLTAYQNFPTVKIIRNEYMIHLEENIIRVFDE
jgi:hypothetical protein